MFANYAKFSSAIIFYFKWKNTVLKDGNAKRVKENFYKRRII